MPLDVLITGPYLTLPGGVVNYVSQLLEHFDSSRVSYTYVKVAKSAALSPIWLRPFEYLTSILRFGGAVLRVRPDLVHLNPSLNRTSLPLHICLLLLAKMLGQRVYLFFHGWEEEVAMAMIRGTWPGRFLRWLLGRADYYSVLCERFRDQLIQAGWRPEDVVVLPLMVEVDKYHRSASQGGEISGSDGRFRVLFLSRLTRDKGVWVMMEAIDWLRRTHPDVTLQFVFAGDGPQSEPLKAHVRSNGLGNIVQFPGYVGGEDKYAVFRSAELFLLPSFHAEGFPTVIIEALAAGLPIIYTPVGALAEILGPENGGCIELADLSGEVVGREILSLYLDPERRRTMGTANQALAREYDVKTVCARTTELYRYVVESE